jgi:methionyl-tRNA formyltransferase
LTGINQLKQLEKEIRAFSGWPKSNTSLNEIDCVITNASVINAVGTPGKLFIQDKKLCVYCGSNALQINTIKPAGKKEMSSEAFLAGYN